MKKEKQIIINKEWLELFPELINGYILPHIPLEIRALKKIKKQIEFILHRRAETLNKKLKFEDKQLLQIAVPFCQEYDESDLFRVSEQISCLEDIIKLVETTNKKYIHGNKL